MILPDTSIWINHFRSENELLAKLLQKGSILMHPFVVAELAMGSLRDRNQTISGLERLPQVISAQLFEVRALVDRQGLYGRGIGLIDAHLLASVLIDSPTLLWTVDKRLKEVAKELGVNADLLEDLPSVH